VGVVSAKGAVDGDDDGVDFFCRLRKSVGCLEAFLGRPAAFSLDADWLRWFCDVEVGLG